MAFILITGYPSLQECIDALDLGIHEILLKPIEVDELLGVTDEAIPPEISVSLDLVRGYGATFFLASLRKGKIWGLQ